MTVGNLEKGEKVFQMMKKSGLKPDVVTYTSMINGFVKAKKLRAAEKIVTMMIESGCTPNCHSFAPLLYGYGREKNLKGVDRMLKQMRDLNVEPNLYILKQLKHLYEKMKLVDRIKDITEKILDLESRGMGKGYGSNRKPRNNSFPKDRHQNRDARDRRSERPTFRERNK